MVSFYHIKEDIKDRKDATIVSIYTFVAYSLVFIQELRQRGIPLDKEWMREKQKNLYIDNAHNDIEQNVEFYDEFLKRERELIDFIINKAPDYKKVSGYIEAERTQETSSYHKPAEIKVISPNFWWKDLKKYLTARQVELNVKETEAEEVEADFDEIFEMDDQIKAEKIIESKLSNSIQSTEQKKYIALGNRTIKEFEEKYTSLVNNLYYPNLKEGHHLARDKVIEVLVESDGRIELTVSTRDPNQINDIKNTFGGRLKAYQDKGVTTFIIYETRINEFEEFLQDRVNLQSAFNNSGYNRLQFQGLF